jgi:hypothetical protein
MILPLGRGDTPYEVVVLPPIHFIVLRAHWEHQEDSGDRAIQSIYSVHEESHTIFQ